jgi:hypothetical protein
MSGPLHHHQTVVHRPFAAAYADATARLAAVGFDGESEFFATDLYKIVLQESDNTVWMLTAVTPTWVQIAGEGSVVTDVDDLTTATGLATEMLRVAASGDELEYRTPAEVLTDIGAIPKLANIIDISSSRDLASADSAAVLTATATATINCPDGLDEGFQCVVARIGGTTTITATTTLQYLDNGAQTAASGVTVDTQCTLLHRGSNVWLVLGEVTPV